MKIEDLASSRSWWKNVSVSKVDRLGSSPSCDFRFVDISSESRNLSTPRICIGHHMGCHHNREGRGLSISYSWRGIK